ncbi:o-succinylbenzoate synthase [Spirosoma daeguense]
MSLHIDYLKHTLHFRFEAGTSRGILTEKTCYILRLRDDTQPDVIGYGECSPLPGLSYDDRPDFEERLGQYCQEFNELDLELFHWNLPIVLTQLISHQFPSILFGFESAMLDFLAGGKRILYPSEFTDGNRPIPINGLIWMGSPAFMRQQIEEKLQSGFTTIKLKIGALDFEQECDLLAMIREQFTADQISLRVDANGAFRSDEAMAKLERLATYNLHSIEQPIRAGQPELMADLCQHSPLPIALDEELIGQMEYVHKFRLLKKIQPQFIILKPTLLGGLHHCDEWIEIAGRLNIGWWITSALESNIGLNTIAQYTANHKYALPQGLGTGQLYTNNFQSPLVVDRGQLYYLQTHAWNLVELTEKISNHSS